MCNLKHHRTNLHLLAALGILAAGYGMKTANAAPPAPSNTAAIVAALPDPGARIRAIAIEDAFSMRHPTTAVVEDSRYCADLPGIIGQAAFGNPRSWQIHAVTRHIGTPIYCAVALHIPHSPHSMDVVVYQLFPFNIVSSGAVTEDFKHGMKGVK